MLLHKFSIIKSTWLVCHNNPTITKITPTPLLLGQKVISLVIFEWHCWNQSYPGKKDRWILWSLLIQFSVKVIVILLGRYRRHLERAVKLLLRFVWGAGWQPILYDWQQWKADSENQPMWIWWSWGGWWSRRLGWFRSLKNRSTAQVLEKRRPEGQGHRKHIVSHSLQFYGGHGHYGGCVA